MGDPKTDVRRDQEVIRIPPLAYLRSVLALAWGALRHPPSTTYVDLSTGRAVHVPPPRGR